MVLHLVSARSCFSLDRTYVLWTVRTGLLRRSLVRRLDVVSITPRYMDVPTRVDVDPVDVPITGSTSTSSNKDQTYGLFLMPLR